MHAWGQGPNGTCTGIGPYCHLHRDKTPMVHTWGQDPNGTCMGTGPYCHLHRDGLTSRGDAELWQAGRSSPVWFEGSL